MKSNVAKLTAAALTAAVIFIVTWGVRVPIPGSSGGYINIGDVVIYLSSLLLGPVMGAAAAAVGSIFADLAGGAVIYAPATFVIKGLIWLVCYRVHKGGGIARFSVACFAGGLVMTAGYALYELFVFGAAYAIAGVPFNLIQWIGATVIASALFPAAKRLRKAVFSFVR